jgi:hypothetical protein
MAAPRLGWTGEAVPGKRPYNPKVSGHSRQLQNPAHHAAWAAYYRSAALWQGAAGGGERTRRGAIDKGDSGKVEDESLWPLIQDFPQRTLKLWRDGDVELAVNDDRGRARADARTHRQALPSQGFREPHGWPRRAACRQRQTLAIPQLGQLSNLYRAAI